MITTIKDSIVDPATGESKITQNQYISIITFDSEVSILVEQKQNIDELITVLDSIEIGGNSTNLNGAIEAASELWENEISLEQISYGSLIVFTDGNDTSQIVTQEQALKAISGKDIYFIAIGDEVDTTELSNFTSESNIFSEFDYAELSEVLDSTFTRVKTYEDGLYILSYASPIRAGSHELTIEAIDDYTCNTAINDEEAEQISSTGDLTNCDDKQNYTFNANDFSDVSTSLSIIGTADTFLDTTSFSAKLRWSNNEPEYKWEVETCTGTLTYDVSDDEQSIIFERTSDTLAGGLVTLTESVTGLSVQSYVILQTSSSDIELFYKICKD